MGGKVYEQLLRKQTLMTWPFMAQQSSLGARDDADGPSFEAEAGPLEKAAPLSSPPSLSALRAWSSRRLTKSTTKVKEKEKEIGNQKRRGSHTATRAVNDKGGGQTHETSPDTP